MKTYGPLRLKHKVNERKDCRGTVINNRMNTHLLERYSMTENEMYIVEQLLKKTAEVLGDGTDRIRDDFFIAMEEGTMAPIMAGLILARR